MNRSIMIYKYLSTKIMKKRYGDFAPILLRLIV